MGNGHCNHLFAWMQFSTPWLKCQQHRRKDNMPKKILTRQSVLPDFCCSSCGVWRAKGRSFFSFFVGWRWHDVVLPTMNRRSHTISIFSGLKSYAPAMMASMGLLAFKLLESYVIWSEMLILIPIPLGSVIVFLPIHVRQKSTKCRWIDHTLILWELVIEVWMEARLYMSRFIFRVVFAFLSVARGPENRLCLWKLEKKTWAMKQNLLFRVYRGLCYPVMRGLLTKPL